VECQQVTEETEVFRRDQLSALGERQLEDAAA
jgi:hypothetical protein